MNHLFFYSISIICLVFASCNAPADKKETMGKEIERPSSKTASNTSSKDSLKAISVRQPPTSPIESEADTFGLNYIMGKFDPSKNASFVKIAPPYADRTGLFLRKEVYDKFKEMHIAAKKEGIRLIIRSATRSFYAQKAIWEGKWTGKRKLEGGIDASKVFPNPKTRALKILEFSSMPGTSRHHWGTDIDLNNFTNAYFEKGKGLQEYQWLQKNAASFGFCQVYTPKDAQRPKGYEEEKWHWSYVPIAKKITTKAKQLLSNEMIRGFKGADTAETIDVVNNYILGINRDCW